MHLHTTQILLLAFGSLFALTSAGPRHKEHHTSTITPPPAVPTDAPPQENYAGVSAFQEYCSAEAGTEQGCF